MPTELQPDNYWHRPTLRLRDFDEVDEVNDSDMTISAVISTGDAVRREYGFERLEISRKSVNVGRLESVGIPILDSHRIDSIGSALGRVAKASARNGLLYGVLQFNKTEAGERAFGMVKRGEIRGISPGYRVEAWRIEDSDGNEINPESNAWSLDDLHFIATRWELLETSVCAVPQDGRAVIASGADRSYPDPPADPHRDIRERMEIRTRMMLRANGLPTRGVFPGQSLSGWRHTSVFDRDRDDDDAGAARVRLPCRDLVRYGDSDNDGFRRIQMPPERQYDPPWGR
jgi:hypothetical protein